MRRYSPLRGRRLSLYEAAAECFVTSPSGAWVFLNIFNPVDKRLLPLTNGKLSMALGAPVGLLETIGARTQRRRHTPLLYLHDEDAIVLIASNGGRPHSPAWLHNLNAHNRARFLSREAGWREYRARVAAGPERDARWARSCDLYAGYPTYQQRAGGRQIPVVVLEPADT